MKKRGLGRGLGDLGLSELLGELHPVAAVDGAQKNSYQELSLQKLFPSPYQPRKTFDPERLAELAESVKAQGILQPILVRALENGYEIIAGERRWRAAKMAGLEKVPVIVREIPDSTAMAISLIENIQRADLNPLEESQAIARLIEEHELSHQQVAESLGKSRTAVTNLLRLQKLEENVKTLLSENKIEMGHARALLGLNPEDQNRIALEVMVRQLSVRETEKMIQNLQSKSPAPEIKKPDPDIARLERELSGKLGATVKFQQSGTSGKGKLTIFYHSLDELEGILDRIK